jgi:hypothetical protein
MMAIGNDNLFERQYDVAMGQYNHQMQLYTIKPDTGMLVWLGKQRLNQRDKTDLTSGDEQMLNAPPAQITVQIISQPRNDKRQNDVS